MKKYLRQFAGILGLISAIAGAPAHAEAHFSQLTPQMMSSMEQQRKFIATLVEKKLPGKKLTKSASDFSIFQEIIDKKLLRPQQTWELQALGICFGDALTSYIPGLKWVLVTDEYGTDPILRYRNSSMQVSALTIISKRVEDGEDVNIVSLAEVTKGYLAKEEKSLR
jgi:hypothetical protein